MTLYFSINALFLGLIVGSFINALSFRFNTGFSIMHGRSKCMRCGHTLHALDLIPLLSYLLLEGKCRWCGTKISLQYPLVEGTAALLAFGVAIVAPTPLLFAVGFVFWMLVLFIVIYDIKHTMIPSNCSFLLGVCALVYLYLSNNFTFDALLAGPILAAPFLLLSVLSRETWMGSGDGFFELSFGWLLGLLPGFTALMLAIWSGAIVGVLLIAYSHLPWVKSRAGFTMKSELPFAPFLALGALLVYFFHVDLFSTYLALF